MKQTGSTKRKASSDHVRSSVRYSVVIPTFNEEQHLGACLKKIREQAPDAELIIVDGNSTDRTVEIAQEFGAVVVIEEKRSVGAARTKGLQTAQGEIVVFTDADVVPAPSWFRTIIKPFHDPSVVGVGGMAMPLDGTLLERMGMWTVFGVLSPLLFKMGAPLVTGQNMAFRRETALHVGGFHQVIKPGKIYAEGEDTNMFLRVKKHGRIVHARSIVFVSMRRVRVWGLFKYLGFNIRNYLHLLSYGTPVEEEYGPARQ